MLGRMVEIKDMLGNHQIIRADGRKVHPAYLFKVKPPAESKSRADVFQLMATTPTEEAFRPLDQGGCPLVKS